MTVISDLNICFYTQNISACVQFYQKYFGARVTFDAGWYVGISFKASRKNYYLCFMDPQEGEPLFDGKGVMLNFKVTDVDSEYKRLQEAGIGITEPIKDNPWNDRSFSVTDPLGNKLYIYSDRKPS